MHTIDLQIASTITDIPTLTLFEKWVNSAIPKDYNHIELTIRIVDEEESQELNATYRNKDKPTNVLSFPYDIPENLSLDLMGDIVICAPIVIKEAREQQKPLEAHWAHLTIHSVLHLLGYDHEQDDEATIMETLETKLLNSLGYANPYRIRIDE